MLKVTVLYGHPTNPEDFEKYYAETHMPLAVKMPGVARFELTRFVAGPDGGRPAFYR
ncbi:MAG: EthD family reductase, partial [Acidobacteria bacterium]|nr:EthD family reductase [Acidobacteriota bacterium]